jgi:hypothetical protein
MGHREITAADLTALTGYSRDQLRGLLAELPAFAKRKGEARVANRYSSHDVLLIVICSRLETQYGLKRAVVAALSAPIARCLAAPRALSNGARLVLEFQPQRARYVERLDDLSDGLVVALDPIFSAIDASLAPSFVFSSMSQRDLAFPPNALPPPAARLPRPASSTSSKRRAAR